MKTKWISRKTNKKALEKRLADYAIFPEDENTSPEQSAKNLVENITNICKSVETQQRGGDGKRKSVYWWTPEIGALRKKCNHLRRLYQRKRKKVGEINSEIEKEQAKGSKEGPSEGDKNR